MRSGGESRDGGSDWWKHGVLYQVYPRSFQDSDGDGVGDLRGVIQRLDHLAWLGIDGIWLNPVSPSPNRDWGYDVSDYLDVASEYGGLDAFQELIEAASDRGIRVVRVGRPRERRWAPEQLAQFLRRTRMDAR
jgi:alpha-glucosidase